MSKFRRQEIEPARAKTKPADKLVPLWSSDQWVAEHKLDGYRFLTHFGGGLERTFMTGRRVSKETGKLSEKGLCAPPLWPPDKWMSKLAYTVLDGEVMPPKGAGFRDLAGIMNVEPAKAEARMKEIGAPGYCVFDILYWDGKDVRGNPWSYRKNLLQSVIRDVFQQNSLVAMLNHYADNKLSYYENIVDKGGEGVILKDQDASYGAGWLKIKRFSTLDVVVTGYTDAKHGITGKYDGLIGAVVVSVFRKGSLVEVGQVSGFDDALRHEFTRHQNKYLNSVIEVRAQEMAKDRLRHPRFGRLRPDAEARHATWDKMIADLKAASVSKEDE